MKRIAYSSPWIPPEWIAAHGLRPVRLVPREGATSGIAAGVCPYTAGFLREVDGDRSVGAVVLTTTCDQMRRAAEPAGLGVRRKTFLFNVPSTWRTAAAESLYEAELRRLSEFLVTQGGRQPSPRRLREAMQEHGERRREALGMGAHGTAQQAMAAMADFHATGRARRSPRKSASRGGIPVALVGGPLTRRDFALAGMVERAGGRVVLDGTENGERTFPAAFRRARLARDPFAEMAAAYFTAMAEVSRRPNTHLYEWLTSRSRERGVAGIVLCSYLWCDRWGVEVQRVRETVGLPLLQIHLGGGRLPVSVRTRIEAFMESLPARNVGGTIVSSTLRKEPRGGR